jgi:hypothetical protein
MVRGGDGRIYVAQPDAQQDRHAVYALRPSGGSEEVFKTQVLPKRAHLMGVKASRDRIAAVYLEPDQGPAVGAEALGGKWWIAVYGNLVMPAELETKVYGPMPGPPLCYSHRESTDYFTFVVNGTHLVSMSSP